jgi:hypothetical protein
MTTMRRYLAAVAVLFVVGAAVPLRADTFDDAARAIARRSGARIVGIPFFGLARFAVWIARPEGVHDVRLTRFEGGSFEGVGALEAAELGRGYARITAVRSTRRGESTLIYARPEGERLVRLLIFTHDRHDSVLVEVTIDAEKVSEVVRDEKWGR